MIVAIAGIFDPVQCMLVRVVQQCIARDLKQWSPQGVSTKVTVCGHRCKAIDAGTAQGAQQEGLGLVVLVLGQRQCFAVAQLGGERPAPCLPRCAFEAQACGVIDSYVVHGQVDAQRCALLLAVPHPVVGRGLQAMVHCSSTVESTPPL
ncbi:hypothetical protein G6F68_016741 [Rhizopus microsporus]|nr:hypothetical protein G6F68_016741 [Rhizopus microsporus]